MTDKSSADERARDGALRGEPTQFSTNGCAHTWVRREDKDWKRVYMCPSCSARLIEPMEAQPVEDPLPPSILRCKIENNGPDAPGGIGVMSSAPKPIKVEPFRAAGERARVCANPSCKGLQCRDCDGYCRGCFAAKKAAAFKPFRPEGIYRLPADLDPVTISKQGDPTKWGEDGPAGEPMEPRANPAHARFMYGNWEEKVCWNCGADCSKTGMFVKQGVECPKCAAKSDPRRAPSPLQVVREALGHYAANGNRASAALKALDEIEGAYCLRANSLASARELADAKRAERDTAIRQRETAINVLDKTARQRDELQAEIERLKRGRADAKESCLLVYDLKEKYRTEVEQLSARLDATTQHRDVARRASEAREAQAATDSTMILKLQAEVERLRGVIDVGVGDKLIFDPETNESEAVVRAAPKCAKCGDTKVIRTPHLGADTGHACPACTPGATAGGSE